MRFISSLCWVQQGKSVTPTRLQIEKNEMRKIFAENNAKRSTLNDEDEDEAAAANESDTESKSLDETEKIDRKYNMDEYDNEGLLVKEAFFSFYIDNNCYSKFQRRWYSIGSPEFPSLLLKQSIRHIADNERRRWSFYIFSNNQDLI